MPILRARRSDNRNSGSSAGGQNPYNPGSASGDIIFGNIPNFATPGNIKTIIHAWKIYMKLIIKRIIMLVLIALFINKFGNF